jgi:hypothetical protein
MRKMFKKHMVFSYIVKTRLGSILHSNLFFLDVQFKMYVKNSWTPVLLTWVAN